MCAPDQEDKEQSRVVERKGSQRQSSRASSPASERPLGSDESNAANGLPRASAPPATRFTVAYGTRLLAYKVGRSSSPPPSPPVTLLPLAEGDMAADWGVSFINPVWILPRDSGPSPYRHDSPHTTRGGDLALVNDAVPTHMPAYPPREPRLRSRAMRTFAGSASRRPDLTAPHVSSHRLTGLGWAIDLARQYRRRRRRRSMQPRCTRHPRHVRQLQFIICYPVGSPRG